MVDPPRSTPVPLALISVRHAPQASGTCVGVVQKIVSVTHKCASISHLTSSRVFPDQRADSAASTPAASTRHQQNREPVATTTKP